VLYYANGGPGPATGLLRIHAPKGGTYDGWRNARGQRWSVRDGWFDYPRAHEVILWAGEYFLIADSQVPKIQRQTSQMVSR
jgi:hypothetical protein